MCNQLAIEDPHASARDRANSQFLFARQAQLADNVYIQWSFQSPGHLKRYRHTSPRQPQHDCVRVDDGVEDMSGQKFPSVAAIPE
jgi:hypothetical protein